MLFQTSQKYFSEILEESRQKLVLADFYAPWCAPCRVLAPELERLSDQYESRLSAYSVNADTEPELTERYQIKELPTVILFRNAEILAKWERKIPLQELEEKIRLS